MEELYVEGKLFSGPDGLFRTEAYGVPVGVAQLGKELRHRGCCGIGGAGKVLGSGLYVCKGEGRYIGNGRQRLEAQGRQQAEGSDETIQHKYALCCSTGRIRKFRRTASAGQSKP